MDLRLRYAEVILLIVDLTSRRQAKYKGEKEANVESVKARWRLGVERSGVVAGRCRRVPFGDRVESRRTARHHGHVYFGALRGPSSGRLCTADVVSTIQLTQNTDRHDEQCYLAQRLHVCTLRD